MKSILLQSSIGLTAGVDEVGRGPLAAPVVAAAVILDPEQPITGLADSKKLSAKQRECLFQHIMHRSLSYAVALASVEEIDKLNILKASLLAMQRAIEGLTMTPHQVLVDGRHCPHVTIPVTAVVKGDLTIDCISAASIVAKVIRDKAMQAQEKRYPGYGFAQHKGYPTRGHLKALQKLGACPIHRRSFAPVKSVLQPCLEDERIGAI